MDYSRHFHSIGPSFSSQIETHECLSSLQSPNCSRLSSPDNSWSSTASLSWIIFVQKVLLLKKIDSHSNSITYSITNVLSYVCIACATYFSEGHYTSYQKWHFWECSYFLFTYIRRSISQVPVAETSFFSFYLCDTCIIKSLCFILSGESKRTEWVKPVLETVQTKSGHREFAGTYYPAFSVHCKHHSVFPEKCS